MGKFGLVLLIHAVDNVAALSLMRLTSRCINSPRLGGNSYSFPKNAVLLEGCFAAEGGGCFNVGEGADSENLERELRLGDR